MAKTFLQAKIGDKVYKILIEDSVMWQSTTDGMVTKEYTIKKIEQWRDFYTHRLTLEDNRGNIEHAEVNVNNECSTCPVGDGVTEHPMALNMALYSLSAHKVVETAMVAVEMHNERMSKLKDETTLLLNRCITMGRIQLPGTMSRLPEEVEERELTEVEFAEMAL